jgi:DNA repair ATPase RecN
MKGDIEMADVAVIPNYEAMVESLGRFISSVSDSCNEMESAGKECVENCDADEASTKSNNRLGNCISRYRGILETAQNVKTAIQMELEDLYRLRDKINQMED